MSSKEPQRYAGLLPFKLVFSAVLFGDELDSHCTSTLHRWENTGIAGLISVLASGLRGNLTCSQLLTCTIEEFSTSPKAI